MQQRKVLKVILTCALLFFCATAIISLIIGLKGIFGALEEGAASPGRIFLGINSLHALLSAGIWTVVAWLIAVVRSRREVFSKRQSLKLCAIGCLFMLRFFVGFLLPTFEVIGPSKVVEKALGSAPTVDLFMLSMAIVFFALACVFEYGRILQEDSDNIL